MKDYKNIIKIKDLTILHFDYSFLAKDFNYYFF